MMATRADRQPRTTPHTAQVRTQEHTGSSCAGFTALTPLLCHRRSDAVTGPHDRYGRSGCAAQIFTFPPSRRQPWTRTRGIQHHAGGGAVVHRLYRWAVHQAGDRATTPAQRAAATADPLGRSPVVAAVTAGS